MFRLQLIPKILSICILPILVGCAGDRRPGNDERASARAQAERGGAPDSVIQQLPSWDSTAVRPASFTTELFSGVPKEVDGCTGLFASDSSSLAAGSYVFVTDLQTRGFLKVNGEMVRLERQAYKLAENAIVETYSGGGFRVEISVEKMAQLGEEVWLYGGTVRVIRGREQQVLRVAGEVGC